MSVSRATDAGMLEYRPPGHCSHCSDLLVIRSVPVAVIETMERTVGSTHSTGTPSVRPNETFRRTDRQTDRRHYTDTHRRTVFVRCFRQQCTAEEAPTNAHVRTGWSRKIRTKFSAWEVRKFVCWNATVCCDLCDGARMARRPADVRYLSKNIQSYAKILHLLAVSNLR